METERGKLLGLLEDGTSALPEGNGDLISEEFYLGPVDRLGDSVG